MLDADKLQEILEIPDNFRKLYAKAVFGKATTEAGMEIDKQTKTLVDFLKTINPCLEICLRNMAEIRIVLLMVAGLEEQKGFDPTVINTLVNIRMVLERVLRNSELSLHQLDMAQCSQTANADTDENNEQTSLIH
jgi:hypothetical protein